MSTTTTQRPDHTCGACAGRTHGDGEEAHDLQGNNRAPLNSSGAVVSTMNQPVWGQVSDSFGSGGLTPLQYQGTYTDPWTGFVFDMSRWYDPSTAQFISQDPLVDQTMQPYTYAADQPTTSSDPTGEYRYEDRWDIGAIQHTHSPQAVMKYYKDHFGSVFPASSSCGRIVADEICNLRLIPSVEGFLGAAGLCLALPFLPFICPLAAVGAVLNAFYVNKVQVEYVRPTSFTFMVLNGPFGAHDHITFSTDTWSRYPDRVFLTERAYAAHANAALEWVTENFGFPERQFLWQPLCMNLVRHFGSADQTCASSAQGNVVEYERPN